MNSFNEPQTQNPHAAFAHVRPFESARSPPIITAFAAYEAIECLIRQDVEEFWALALGPTKNLLRSEMLFRGTVDTCLVHPRDVFRFACLNNASSIIVAHNHPSGELEPSEQDLLITRKLIRASKLFEIPVIDHLIITRGSFASFAMKGWCRF